MERNIIFHLNKATPENGGKRNLQRMWTIRFVNNMKQIGLVDAPMKEEEHKTWQSAWCMAKAHR